MSFITNFDPAIRAEGLQEGLIKGRIQGRNETKQEDHKQLEISKTKFFKKYHDLFTKEQELLIIKEIQI